LVVSQVALAFVLVCGAGLLVRSFARLTSVDAGFESTNVVTMGFLMQMDRDTDGERLTSYVGQVIDAVRAVPGVREAAMTSALPLQGWGFGMPFRVDGQVVEPSKRQACYFKMVTPGYFTTLGMRLRKGRALSESDVRAGQPVVVVNETFAKRFLEKGDPIGRHVYVEQIVTGKRELGAEIPWQVVGVVADEKVSGLDNTSAGVYVSYAQSPIVGIALLAKGVGEPSRLIGSIQRAIWQLNRNQALPDARTLTQIKSESLGGTRLRTLLLGVFAGLALLLAAVGVYGVLAYVTAQRTQEMGVRAALGASSWDLVRLVVGGGSIPVGLGLAIGLGGAFALTRLVQTLLFETSPTDPVAIAATSAVLLFVALTACYLPARRASRVDPMVALRTE
jgi:predicted permease